MAFWMVWKGWVTVPSAVMSLPASETGMHSLQSSSTTPSQSSSIPSHVASVFGGGGFGGMHTAGTPAEHAEIIVLHAPRPHVIIPMPLSAVPSQSSSAPLQASALGSTSPTHALQMPAVQVCVPAVHAPTPDVPAGPE